MSTPAVSVVVPVGRVDGDLLVQLDALARQVGAPDHEIVLARNTSDPDQTRRLTEAAAARGERFRVIDASARRGASFARNTGAAAALAPVLAFCDGDDVVHDDWLGRLVAGLDHHDVVGGHLEDIGVTEAQRRARPPATPDALPTFLGHPYIASGNLALGRAAFEAVGGFDERLRTCEDLALSWSLTVAGNRLGFVPDAVVDYRHRDGVVPMLRQHYAYGRGMGQVLARYGVPDGDGWAPVAGAALLRPNSGSGGAASTLGVLRRLALAAGRVVGIIGERRRGR